MVLLCQAKKFERFFRGPIGVACFAYMKVCLPLLLFMRAVPRKGFVLGYLATRVVMVRRMRTT